jgi:hypothetical protein
MADPDDDAWFAAKRYGFGAGPPVAWQGWALLAAYIAALALLRWLLVPGHRIAWAIVFVALTITLVTVAARHTRGGWHWRWGKPD